MFSHRNCAVADCRRHAVEQADTCWDHLPDRQAWWTGFRSWMSGKKELTGLNLSRVQLLGLDLRGRTFEGCNFTGALGEDLVLDGCRFRHSFFDFSVLSRCSLRGVSMVFCSASGCRFEDADWTGSDLLHVNFNALEALRTKFSESDLYFTRFIGSKLEKVDFIDCNLKKTQFTGAALLDVNFRYSNYEEAEFDLAPEVRT